MNNHNRPITEAVEQRIKVGVKWNVSFIGLTHEGLGICKIDGKDIKGNEYHHFPIFVADAIPFEEGLIEITKLQPTFGYGKVIRIYPNSVSKYRAQPRCSSYFECGGCNVMHMSYEKQLAFKQNMVVETLQKIGNITEKVEPVIGMNHPWFYRNKVQVPFGSVKYKAICGFYRRESHEIMPLEQCFIQSDISSEIVKFVRNLCNEFGIKGYQEAYHEGIIRHVLVRTNVDLSQIMVVLVVTTAAIVHLADFCSKLTKRYPQIVSIVLNMNKNKNNVILGDINQTVYGKSYIEDTLCGCRFQIGATSFYQVNSIQTEVLYQKALELANLSKDNILIDAYCGIGTIGIIASSKVKQVYGVEINAEAVANAKTNADINEIENIHFVCNHAEKQLALWQEAGIKPDVIVVDPPRKGCDQTLLNSIIEMQIPKMIYVSCDPATLARDLKHLTSNGYVILNIQPVDMFPHSSHVETVVLLRKK